MLRVTPSDGWRAIAPTLAAPPACGPLVIRALGHAVPTKEAAGVIEHARVQALSTRTDVRTISGR
eukprot:5261444-Alexandrium_andersonii.AAC.1